MGDNDEGKTKKKPRQSVGCKILGAAVEEIRVERGQTVKQLFAAISGSAADVSGRCFLMPNSLFTSRKKWSSR